MEFEYISDSVFQEILRRDYNELKKCHEAGAAKSILVLCGSILEAMLSDYFCENLPPNETKATILQKTLGTLLDLAETSLIITKSDKNLATVIKDYRNIIHPGREVRKQENFDIGSAELSIKVLELILNKIENKYREKFDINADDILDNLDEDWNYSSIYGLVITKLNSNQRKKLFEEFLDIEVILKENYEFFKSINDDSPDQPIYQNIQNVKDFVTQLKPLLSQETIIQKLNDLKKHVTSAEPLEALSLYNLVHEDLILLSPEDQELIGIYMIGIYMQTCYFEDAKAFYYDKTFSTIGKYLSSDRGIDVTKNTLKDCIINFTMDPKIGEIHTFEQVLNSFTEANKKIIVDEIENWLGSTKLELTKFRKVAFSRGLIKDLTQSQ